MVNNKQQTFAQTLLAWYDGHKRSFPWRGSTDPYAIWVSETMLQQTRTETVRAYYPRFMERFPDIRTLAEADEADVLKLWEGLGYYRRARNLQKGAKQVMECFGGSMPQTRDDLLKLCGIGDYTAGAIASIAFSERVPAVDGNVIRVVSRWAGIRENTAIPTVLRELKATAAALVPQDRPGDFNQAMMDLGATLCTPGTPDCMLCPLCDTCDACREGDADELPVLPRKTPPKEEYWSVCILHCNGKVLMQQRTEKLLEGLWVFPMCEETDHVLLPAALKKLTGLAVSNLTEAGHAKHVFTHRVWQMTLFTADAENAAAKQGFAWFTPEETETIAIPTAMKAAVKLLQTTLKNDP